jgi:hypothetical protein
MALKVTAPNDTYISVEERGDTVYITATKGDDVIDLGFFNYRGAFETSAVDEDDRKPFEDDLAFDGDYVECN